MSLSQIDWIIIIAFFALSLSISIFMRKKGSGSMADFFLGGRKMPWLLAGVSMVATTFAADTPLAVTELVAKHGISGNWLWWSFLAGGMLTTFFFAHLWHKAGVLTEVELVELRYSGKPAALLRGFKAIYLGLFMNVLIMGWVNLALVAILEIFFGIQAQESLKYVLAAMLIAAAYSSISGIWGIAVTDAVQFVVAMTGTIILAVLVLRDPAIGGVSGLQESLPASSFQFFPSLEEQGLGKTLSLSIGSFLAYMTMQWWASWYPGAEPGGGGYVAQRFMSTKNSNHAAYASLFFQVAHYCLRPWPWILVALASLVLYPDLADPKHGYILAMRDFLPSGLKGLLLTAFFAAYMSTISTQLNWGASYLVNDGYKRFIRPDASEKDLVKASRIITLLLMLVAAVITSFMDSISGVWTFLIECGAGLGLVLILRWYYWRINAWSEISASLAPFLGYAIAHFGFDWVFPNSFFFTLGFTTLTWVLVTMNTKPTNSDTLRRFYEKVKPQGFWDPIRKTLADPPPSRSLIWHVLAWISGIIFTYSLLFLTGYFFFGNAQEILLCAGISLVSLIIMVWIIRTKKLWH